jgi:hypothetical protein
VALRIEVAGSEHDNTHLATTAAIQFLAVKNANVRATTRVT